MAKAESPNAMELARGHTRLEQAVQRSRQMLRKRALVAGVAGMVLGSLLPQWIANEHRHVHHVHPDHPHHNPMIH